MKDVDEQILKEMTMMAKAAQEKYYGSEVTIGSSSTDCNIPHSLGIPAVCAAVYIGGGEHTRQEWLVKSSLKTGFAAALEMILNESGVNRE